MLQKFSDNLWELKEGLVTAIFPRRCPVCDDIVESIKIRDGKLIVGELIHDNCKKKIRYVRGSTCMKCGKPLGQADNSKEYCCDCERARHVYDRGFAVFDYRSISGSVYKFKYMGRQEYARFYGRAVYERYGRALQRLGIEAIIPVPMYKGKKLIRGYNQAEILAKMIGRELGIPVYTDVVARNKNTLPMKELDARGRRNNLKKAFNITRNDVKFKCILIIDDIYTTGSTIDEIAHEFRVVGTRKIYFLTLAIGQTT